MGSRVMSFTEKLVVIPYTVYDRLKRSNDAAETNRQDVSVTKITDVNNHKGDITAATDTPTPDVVNEGEGRVEKKEQEIQETTRRGITKSTPYLPQNPRDYFSSYFIEKEKEKDVSDNDYDDGDNDYDEDEKDDEFFRHNKLKKEQYDAKPSKPPLKRQNAEQGLEFVDVNDKAPSFKKEKKTIADGKHPGKMPNWITF